MTFGERHLALPDLFPARLAGEPWGDRRLAIDVAGRVVGVEGLSPEQHEAVAGRFVERGGSEPGLTVRVYRAFPGDFLPVDLLGKEYTFELSYEPEAVLLAGPEWLGRIEWRPSMRAGLWVPSGGAPAFPGAFENLLRVATAYRLVEEGGALFHSAAVVDHGRAHLFVGHSGAGKSTLSKKSAEEGKVVLSDELNALAREGGRLVVRALPFAGDFGGPAPGDVAFPLAAVYAIEKGPGTAVGEMSPAAALGLLLARSPFVNADPYRVGGLLANLESLMRDAPGRRLTFALDRPVWADLRREEVAVGS